MNPILASNESSAVVATIRESKTQNPWVYTEGSRLTTPHSVQMLGVPVSSGSVRQNTSFTFNLPKNGILGNTWLCFTMPDDAPDQSLLSPKGLLDLINEIRIETSGRVIERLSRSQLLHRIAGLSYSEKQAAYKAYKMGTAAAPQGNGYSGGYTTCLFLPWYFSKEFGRYSIDTDFQEATRIVVQLGDCKILNSGGAATAYSDHIPTDCELMCEYRNVTDEVRSQILQQNYSSGMLSRVIQRSTEEAPLTDTPATTTDKTVTYELKETDTITNMTVSVTMDGLPATPTAEDIKKVGSPCEIKHVKLVFSGQTVFDVSGEFLKHYGRSYGRAGIGDGTSGDATENAHADLGRCYQLSFDANQLGLSNAVSLREISAPRLIVTYRPAVANALHTCNISYNSVSFLTTSSATGRTNLSISS